MDPTDHNQRSLRIICGLFACVMLVGSSSSFADANDGEYLGFRLGDKYSAGKGTGIRNHITGALIFDLSAGQQDHHVDTISIYVSPTTSIIGSIFGEWYFTNERAAHVFADRYLDTLEKKYQHWMRYRRSLTHDNYQLWVSVEEKPPLTEHWLSAKRYRVDIGLIYAPDSLGRSEWMAMVFMEANKLELTARQ